MNEKETALKKKKLNIRQRMMRKHYIIMLIQTKAIYKIDAILIKMHK